MRHIPGNVNPCRYGYLYAAKSWTRSRKRLNLRANPYPSRRAARCAYKVQGRTIVKADGTDWSPGGLAQVHCFTVALWNKPG